jgi:hypothetical protein
VGAPKLLNDGHTSISVAVCGGLDIAHGSPDGLTVVSEDIDDFFDGSATHITDVYNTGPMIRVLGAWINEAV